MKSHNYWKLKLILTGFTKYILWALGLSLLLLLPIVPIQLNTISTIISIFSVVLAFLWSMFDKRWWKIKRINKHLPDKFSTPIIEGRWEGILTRGKDKRPFVLEITQTFTSVSCQTFSPTSFSNSINAELLFDEETKSHQLAYLWIGNTSNTTDGSSSTNKFYGYTLLNINAAQKKKCKFAETIILLKTMNQKVPLKKKTKITKKIILSII